MKIAPIACSTWSSRIIFAFLLVIIALGLSFATYTDWLQGYGWNPTRSTSSEATADEVEYFVKELPPVIADDTDRVAAEFTVENPLAREVRFASIRHSCSCSDSAIEHSILGPGQSTKLTIALSTAARSGRQQVTCTLDEIDGKSRIYELRTTLYRRALFAEPIVHFGVVEPGGTYEKRIEIICAAITADALPTEVKIEAAGLSLGGIESRVERQKDGCWLKRTTAALKLIAPADMGPGTRLVRAFCRVGDAAPCEAAMTVDWYVRSIFDVKPAQIAVAHQKPGLNISRTIQIRRSDGMPLAIKEIRVPSEYISATHQAVDGNTVSLSVTVRAQDNSGLTYGEIIVVTDHHNAPAIRIPLAILPGKE